MGYEQGMRTEYFVMEHFQTNGLDYVYVDDWYDVKVGPRDEHVEIKSTNLLTKRGKTRKHQRISYCAGQFHFRDDHNRETQRSENVWYAFVVCHKQQMMLLGFIKAQGVPNKRFLGWQIVTRKQLLTLEEFVEAVK